VRLLFVRTDRGLVSLGSRLIRAYEGGLASHCGAVLDDGSVIDTTWPHGVRVQPRDEFLASRELVAELDLPVPDEAAAQAWMRSRLGHGYDLRDILSFLLWRDIGSRSRYVCSGFLLRAALAGGLHVRERHDRWGVRHMLILADRDIPTS